MGQIELYHDYRERLERSIRNLDLAKLCRLADALWETWKAKRQVFICGNGGSAVNAMHMANDFLYGVSKGRRKAIRVHALTANQSVLTCLANDLSYAEIFSYQLGVLAQRNDILIALSGSGNSPNVVRAIEKAKELGMITFAVLGYDGGRCLEIAEDAVHVPVNDMQVAEDLQLVVGHMVMQWLHRRLSLEGETTDI
ncbi:MAG: SIS domain-containing protein [Pseudomonadota bacterium]|nr:SIS domain-containing protein [Pseudomonadota bacterium]